MFRVKNILVLILVIGLLPVNVFSQDDSRGLVVQPSVYTLELDKGNTYNYSIKLENSSDQDDSDIQVTFETFAASSQEGLPQILPFQENDSGQDWISVDQQKFNLPKHDARMVSVNLRVPEQASAGGYYYAIIFNKFSTGSQNSQVILNQRLVSLLFLNIKGEAGREVQFADFKTNQYIYDPFLDFLEIKSDISLKGKSFYKPTGVVWGYQGDKPISSVSLNPNNRIILPNSIRSFESVSKPVVLISWLSGAGQKYDEWKNADDAGFKKPWFGSVQLVANANYVNFSGDLEVSQAKTQILFLPWKSGLILLVVVLIITAVYVIVRKQKNRKIKI